MTIDERLDKLTAVVEAMQADTAAFKQEVRQGFQVLTELHADTQREMQKLNQGMLKLANSMSALADHVADHESRLDELEGK